MMLTSKPTRTLAAIFENPVRADIRWADIETLLRALGADIKQGSGSRVRVTLSDRHMNIHVPHPQPTIFKDGVRSVRRFLIEAGVSP